MDGKKKASRHICLEIYDDGMIELMAICPYCGSENTHTVKATVSSGKRIVDIVIVLSIMNFSPK